MAQNTRIAGVDWSSLGLGFTAPIVTGLVGWWWLGGSSALSIPNQSSLTATAGAPSGTITYNTGYCSFAASGYIDTALAETTDMTVIVVARHPTGTYTLNGTIFGNWQSGGAAGFWMGLNSGSNFTASALWSSQGSALAASTSNTSWRCYAGSASATSVVADNLSTAVQGTTSPAGTRTLNTGRTLRIGSFAVGGTAGPIDVAAVAVFDRVLTTPEKTTLNTYFKTAMLVRNAAIILP